MKSVTIAGDVGKVRISVESYERDKFEDIEDANWLNCRIEFDIIGFSGIYPASIETKDFIDFYNCVNLILNNFDGIAKLETKEESINLNIKMLKTGGATITGTLRNIDKANITVDFSFDSDQTYISKAAIELNKITKHFPFRSLD
jgi:hypothetical protein